MKRLMPLAILLALLVSALACGLPAPPTTPEPSLIETLTAAELETIQAATELAQQVTQALPEATSTPPDQELSPEPPTPTSLPPCEPLVPPPQGLPLPAGLVASRFIDTEVVRLVNFEGQMVISKNAPGLVWQEPDELHVAGGIAQGRINLPFVYRTLEDLGTLKLNVNDVITELEHTPELIALSGAPGNPILSYSLNEAGPNGWISRLYVAQLGDFPNVPPQMTRDEGDGYVFLPLVVRAVGGQAEGVWYTLSMYGIGDLIFRPYRGLYYLDLGTGVVTEFVDFDKWISAMSPDQTWVAYRPAPPVDQPGLILRNLATCVEVPLPLHPETNLGAGFAVFSPDNQHVAWIEANGVMLEDVHGRLRVATTGGVIVAEAPFANLYGLAGGEELTWLTPVGWVDNNQILVDLSLQDWSENLLVRVEMDFHNPILLTDGRYMGFYYP